jgi:alginate O-acetyltransferase complex protein AlgI
MLFNSVAYALFLLAAWSVYWLVPARWRLDVLLVASYVFYANWSKSYAGLMFVLTVLNYLFGLALARSARRRLLLVAFVAVDLGVLGIFKYWNFAAHNVDAGLAAAGLAWRVPVVDLLLPLGISFFTFEFIHYLVDISRGATPVHGFRVFHVFAAFFPTQIAGPIKRFQQFVPNLQNVGAMRLDDMTGGLRLIAQGLVKKVIVADTLAPLADRVFQAASVRTLGTAEAWIGVVAFSFQIFFDFAAYTDLARGSARLFGFHIPINFNAPYLARSVGEFWRRWHISLSTWLRDYLFIPLGGSRRGLALTVRNIMITMILGGVWHGAAWHFVVWGIYWGFVLSVERLIQESRVGRRLSSSPGRMQSAGTWITTQVLVLVGWVFFRAADLPQAAAVLRAMFTVGASPDSAVTPAAILALVTALGVAGIIVLLLGVAGQRVAWWSRLPTPYHVVALGVALAVTLLLTVAVGPSTGPRFIYFQF